MDFHILRNLVVLHPKEVTHVDKKKVIFLALSILLVGCASVLNDRHQLVQVDTYPVRGANCAMENSKGSFLVKDTPNSTMVHKAWGDLTVICSKTGCPSVSKVVKSSSDGATWGNILLGGGIGAVVDAKTGAGYSYPNTVHVPMEMTK